MSNIGFVVVAKFDTNGGAVKGEPVTRDGHFKVYATREAANRRRYHLGSEWTEVRAISHFTEAA